MLTIKKTMKTKENIFRELYFKGWRKRVDKQSYKSRIRKTVPSRKKGRFSMTASSILRSVKGKLKRMRTNNPL